MRFFRSSALAKAPKFRFAASCSAADAILRSAQKTFGDTNCPRHATPGKAGSPAARHRTLIDETPDMGSGRRFRYHGGEQSHRAAGLLDGGLGGLRRAVDLEGELRLEFADAEDLDAVPRLETTPAATSASTVTGWPASSFLASSASWMRPRLTSLRSVREGVPEAALRQATIERHLAALEALHARRRYGPSDP